MRSLDPHRARPCHDASVRPGPAPDQARALVTSRHSPLPPGCLRRPQGIIELRPEHLPAAAGGPTGPPLAGDVDLAEALRAELMERFSIDARRIRAEGRPTPAPRPPRSPARASCGSMPRPGPSRRALHLRHQRQRQAVPRPSTTADRSDFQLRAALADGPERRVMREGRLQIDLDPNDAYRRFSRVSHLKRRDAA
jgi:hypothetical protein